MRLCIVLPGPVGASETFIRAHLERLPQPVLQLHGQGMDLAGGGQSLRPACDSRKRSRGEIWLDLLPRFAEFRLRRRLFPAPTDVDIAADFLIRNRVGVVLAEYGTTGAFITPACRAANVPLVVHFHGFDASRRGTLLEFEERYQTMFAYASRIIAVSEAMRTKLSALGCPAEKLVVTRCGPHPAFAEIQPNYASNNIVAVGRLVEKKAPHLLLLAFQRALQTRPELSLRMTGDGPLAGVCDDLAQGLGIGKSVRFEGTVSPDEVRAGMAGSFMFVQHSVTAGDGDCEGTPVAVVEAGAAGLPVVATRHAGIMDVVVPGETGLLVEERDVEGMARAMVSLAVDRNLVKRMGEAARRHIHAHFTMEHHIEAVHAALQSAVKCQKFL
jgi:glycosyltransferase involved in cell wall biosynthesis